MIQYNNTKQDIKLHGACDSWALSQAKPQVGIPDLAIVDLVGSLYKVLWYLSSYTISPLNNDQCRYTAAGLAAG